MNPFHAVLAALLAAGAATPEGPAPEESPMSVLKHVVQSIDGENVDLASQRGKVLLVVNVASECGFTPQYAGLQALHERYAPQGFSVLGFPSNDFGGQEPGTNAEIQQFCRKNYGVTFPLFAKSRVVGDDKAPLWRDLTSAEKNAKDPGEVKWNFEKFLIGKDGTIAGRWRSRTSPSDPALMDAIEAELKK